MTSVTTQQLAQVWDELNSLVPVSPVRDEQQYDQAVKKLNELLDIVGDNENHPLYDLLDTLGTLIHAYEESNYPEPSVTGTDVFKFLMAEHQLTPSSFPEIGNEEMVSELLTGKRELSVGNIQALSKGFGISPATFI